MKLNPSDALLSEKDMRKLREKREMLIFGAVCSSCFLIFAVALIVASRVWQINVLGWLWAVFLGPFLIALAVALTYRLFAMWRYLK